MTSPLTSAIINSTWAKYVTPFEDAIGETEEDFALFRQGFDDQTSIKSFLDYQFHLLKEHRSFFENYNYLWCFDNTSYRFAAEAAFQFRLIKMLLNIEKNYLDDIPFLTEPIIVREVLVSDISLQPKTVYQDGLAFILFPLGYFEQAHYVAHGWEALEQKNIEGFQNCITGICAKLIANAAVGKFIDDHFQWNPSPLDQTLLNVEISRYFIKKLPIFQSAVVDISSDNFSDFSQIITYSNEVFLLAHETAHIIAGEHKDYSGSANEIDADRLAFDLIIPSINELIPTDIGVTSLGLSAFAALTFIFIGNASLQIKAGLGITSLKKLDDFVDRSLILQKKIKSFDLTADDQRRLMYFNHWAKEYLQKSTAIVDAIFQQKEEIIELGCRRISELIVDN